MAREAGAHVGHQLALGPCPIGGLGLGDERAGLHELSAARGVLGQRQEEQRIARAAPAAAAIEPGEQEARAILGADDAVEGKQEVGVAGVAEGTIFRVFPDKEALVCAAVEVALDPLPVLAELGGVDLDLPLRERLAEVVRILQRRLTGIFNLHFALGTSGPPKRPEQQRAVNDRVLAAMAAEPAALQVQQLVDAVERFAGAAPQHGDMTIVVLRRL